MKLVIVFGLLLCDYTIQAQDQNREAGEVDSLSAVKIAQQVWLKKFGRMVNLSKPYYATLKNA